MLKLELDWASDSSPGARMAEVGWDEPNVSVSFSADAGPAGWPTVTVVAQGEGGQDAGPRLWAWLVEVYGADEDEASELASLAEWV